MLRGLLACSSPSAVAVALNILNHTIELNSWFD